MQQLLIILVILLIYIISITISLVKCPTQLFIQQQFKQEPLSSLHPLDILLSSIWGSVNFHSPYENTNVFHSEMLGYDRTLT